MAVSESSRFRLLLAGDGLLRAGTDDDLSVEHAARVPVEHALVELVALAVRLHVIDDREVVEMLRAGADEESVERDRRALPVQCRRAFPSRAKAPPMAMLREVTLDARSWRM